MQITEINLYPVKSTRRIALREARVLDRGLEWDRHWMLVDPQGNFVTARDHPSLPLVQGRIDARALRLEAPGMPSLAVPLHPVPEATRQVRIWRDDTPARVEDESAGAWFSRYLGLTCRLVRVPPGTPRAVDPRYGRPEDRVGFADGFPLLLISKGSLADLNGRLEVPVSMRRFRPNLVVDAAGAFAEDDWRRIRVGDQVEFEVAKPCSRCIFTTIDPDSGEKHPAKEPLRTLATYRRRPGDGPGVFFGQNLIPRRTGSIRLGDEVEVLA